MGQTFTYNLNIPDGPNNPSNDQPLMQINTNSIDSLINVDHYTFEDGGLNRDGWHKQCTFPQQTTPTTTSAQLAIYSKPGYLGLSELFMVRDGNVGTETNLTTAKIAFPSATSNGVSWLPGGILIQWGQQSFPGTSNPTGTVNYIVAFPNNCFVVLPTLQANVTTGQANTIAVLGTPGLSSFGWVFTGSTSYNSFYWIAIGN